MNYIKKQMNILINKANNNKVSIENLRNNNQIIVIAFTGTLCYSN